MRPPTIRQNLEKIRDEQGSYMLEEIQIISFDLIRKIMKDEAWHAYLELFVDPTPGENRELQLKRLKREDDAWDDISVTRAICYLFSNGICGGSTGKRLLEGVGDTLDVGLYSNSMTARKEHIEARIAARKEAIGETE